MIPFSQTVSTIGALIGFDTTSSRSNLDCLNFIDRYLRDHGVRSEVVHGEEGKANLLAEVPASDGTCTGGIVVAGHVDTVPAVADEWSTTPFEAVVSGGRLTGRGATDMKAFCGVAVESLIAASRVPLRRSVHLVLTHDEETGCAGARSITQRVAALDPAACVVGEPTSCRVVCAHRGCTRFEVCVRGVAAHTSDPEFGVNAVNSAIPIASGVASIAREFADRATVTLTSVHGGDAVNIVPDSCTVGVEVRHDRTEVESALRARVDALVDRARRELRTLDSRADASVRTLVRVPPLVTSGSGRLAGDVCSREPGLVDVLEPGHECVTSVGFGTEAGIYQQSGIPTILWGPGSIEQAHTVDEFIELAEIRRCVAAFERLAGWLGADPHTCP